MKNIMILAFMFFALTMGKSWAACTTSISRTNSGFGVVLSSTKYNTDLNTAYNRLNAIPGDCVNDATVTYAKLDTSSFAALINGGLLQGCGLVYSSASALSINPCFISVNGKLVRKTSATALSMGCGSCSGEAADTRYYVYVLTTSTGSTLNLIMSTTAPNGDGLDNSGNKVLGYFYNNNSSDIDPLSIAQWSGNQFTLPTPSWTAYSPSFTGFGTVSSTACNYQRDNTYMIVKCDFSTGTHTTVEGKGTLPTGYLTADTNILPSRYVAGPLYRYASSTSSTYNILARASRTYFGFSLPIIVGANDPTAEANGDDLTSTGTYTFTARFPIRGWQ